MKTAPPSYAIYHLISHLRLGAGRHIVETALEQVRRGHPTSVIVSRDVDDNWRTDPEQVKELKGGGACVLCIGEFFKRSPEDLVRAAAELEKILRSLRGPAVCHAHSAMPAVVARWAGAGRVIASCHGFAPGRDPAFDLQDALAFMLCDAVVSPSRAWADELQARFRIPCVQVVPNGLDLRRYPPLDRRVEHSGGAMGLVTVCELTRRKGVDVLLQAMPLVWRSFPSVTLTLIGDGDSRDELRSTAESIDPDGARVRFLGRMEHPYRLLCDYDLFCLPARSDNLPVAVMEAMLAGLPVVATRVGGIPEMVDESGCGLTVESDSPEAAANAISSLLLAGPPHLRSLGALGESFARSRFDIGTSVDSLERVYSKQN